MVKGVDFDYLFAVPFRRRGVLLAKLPCQRASCKEEARCKALICVDGVEAFGTVAPENSAIAELPVHKKTKHCIRKKETGVW